MDIPFATNLDFNLTTLPNSCFCESTDPFFRKFCDDKKRFSASRPEGWGGGGGTGKGGIALWRNPSVVMDEKIRKSKSAPLRSSCSILFFSLSLSLSHTHTHTLSLIHTLLLSHFTLHVLSLSLSILEVPFFWRIYKLLFRPNLPGIKTASRCKYFLGEISKSQLCSTFFTTYLLCCQIFIHILAINLLPKNELR